MEYPTVTQVLAADDSLPKKLDGSPVDAKTRSFLIQQSEKSIKEMEGWLKTGVRSDGAELTEKDRQLYAVAIKHGKERLKALRKDFN